MRPYSCVAAPWALQWCGITAAAIAQHVLQHVLPHAAQHAVCIALCTRLTYAFHRALPGSDRARELYCALQTHAEQRALQRKAIALAQSSCACAQEILLAARDEVKQLPRFAGLILLCAAADAQRTWLMRIEEPFAHLANMIAPHARLVPKAPESNFSRDPDTVRPCRVLALGTCFVSKEFCKAADCTVANSMCVTFYHCCTQTPAAMKPTSGAQCATFCAIG